MSDKLSVIISVGNAPGLHPHLPGAYTGHAEYRDWAVSQGHDVVDFTDKEGHIFNALDIAKTISTPVSNQSLAELWIYFAGHGECSAIQTDYWLLKRDGALAGDVIDVASTRRLATLLGIPRVIIIADACRTTGDLQGMAAQENAVSILPALNIAINPSVECLFATQPGSPSLEVREAHAKAHGIFTTVLMRALRGEVPSVRTRSDDGRKLVVRLQQLRPYLEEQVQSEAASLGFGGSQMPNILPGGSTAPYAVVGDIPNLEVRIDTIKRDGTPASDTEIKLSMLTGPAEVTDIGVQPGPTATFLVPSGCVYESSATGPYTSLLPESPLPLFRLDSPKQGRFRAIDDPQSYREDAPRIVKLLGERNIEYPKNYWIDASESSTSADMSRPRLAITRVISDDGSLQTKAPAAGVYQVVTYDALTGQMASQLQRFTPEDLTPETLETLPDRRIESRIFRNARSHAQLHFEKRTGLTLLFEPQYGPPEVAAPPGCLEGVFLEDGHWRIGGNHSAGMLIRLGSNYLTGAMFNALSGVVRLNAASKMGPVVEDLSYMPASSTRYEFDLRRLPPEEVVARQLVATHCARNGFFEVTTDDSLQFASFMWRLKHYNPIIGLLAAYAYDKEGRADQIIDMIFWFIQRGQSIPFDLVMLAGLSEEKVSYLIEEFHGSVARNLGAWVVPTWPILTQGWSRLSREHLDRFPVLKKVQASLLPGFWSAASGDAAKQFFTSIQEGKLQWI